MTRRAALCAAALAATLPTVSACGDSPGSSPQGEPSGGVATVPGAAPVHGIAEPNAWRRVPALASADETAELIAELGADSHRYVIDWNVAEPRPPAESHRYDFSQFDPMYAADLRRGIRPLLVVLSAPAWAADPGARPGSIAANPPAASHLGDWAEFLRAVARRYPRALGVEVWNEPNLATFWGKGAAGLRPDPARYASLLATSYEAIKSVNQDMLVVGGALAPSPGSSGGDLPPEDFARALFAAGGAAHMDALSLHPYPAAGGAASALAMIDRVRDARDEAGARTPLWLTEIGVSTTGPGAVGEVEQARAIVDLCRAAAAQPEVDAIYVHTLLERPGSPASREPGFGLAEPATGGAPRLKPAYGALRRAFSEGC